MKLQFQLVEEDFLLHQLYNLSRNKKIKRRNETMRLISSMIYFSMGLFLFSQNMYFIAWTFILIGFLVVSFYPFYIKKKYFRRHQSHVKDSVKNRINIPIDVEINSEYIKTEDKTGETITYTDSIKQLIELKDHFIVQLNTDMSMLMPKKYIEDKELFKKLFIENKINYLDEREWKW